MKSSIVIPHDFEMSVTEVTRDQFRAFVGPSRYVTTAESDQSERRGALLNSADGNGTWSGEANWEAWRPDLGGAIPVVCVSWEDALNFCNWLSRRAGLRECYSRKGGASDWQCDFGADGYRLPTEAEWEYAARAGDRTLYPEPEGVLRGHGWFQPDAAGKPHPVGDKEKNARGLRDVWGNAWEWCWDRYSEKPAGADLRPGGPSAGARRVARGGGWCDAPPNSPGATRKDCLPDYCANDLGFRVARTLAVR
jgi:formylglycine-generating enzyme required for sulfatase activity